MVLNQAGMIILYQVIMYKLLGIRITSFLLGLYFAPSVVASALKTAILTSKAFEKLGYNSLPKYNEKRADII